MEWILLAVGLVVGAALGWWWGRRDLAPRLVEATDEAVELAAEKKRFERELRNAGGKAEQTAQELAELEAAKKRTDEALEVAAAELAATKHDLLEAERSAKAVGHKLEKAETSRNELAERVTAAEAAATDSHAKFDQVTDDYVALKRTARQAEEERQAVHSDRDGTVAKLQAATAEAQREAAELRADHDRLEKALSVATARLEALGGSAEAAAEAQDELRALRSSLAAESRRCGDLGSELEKTRSKLSERERELEEIGTGVSTHETEPAAPQDATGQRVEESTASHEAQRPLSASTVEAQSTPGGDSPVEEQTSPTNDEPEPVDAAPAPEPASPASSVESPAMPAEHGDSARDLAVEAPEVDDLQSVKGIGPKFERLLRARNVHTFRHVVELGDDAEWEAYLDTFGGRIEREEWRSQARQLHLEKYGESL